MTEKCKNKPTVEEVIRAAVIVSDVAILADYLFTAYCTDNQWQAIMHLIYSVLKPAGDTILDGIGNKVFEL